MISTDTSANVVQGSGLSAKRMKEGLRGPRAAALVWVSVYLAVSGAILEAANHSLLALMHLAGVVVAAWTCVDERRPARVVGDLLPLLVAPILYGEIPVLIAALGSSYHDALVQRWELALFGSHPSRALATIVPNRAFSELLHIGYLAYYPAIFVPPLLLYARGNRPGYAQTVVALTAVYVTCWVSFVVLPVEGPRYLWTPDAPDGPARRLAVAILAAGSSRGAAFPSSHMAVSVVQMVMAFRWQPKVGAILALISVLVGVGAVYGGFHYGVDMVAGAILGAFVAGVTLRVSSKTESNNGDRPVPEIA
jgi:membrane-associated phospholipid phosphatase